MNDLYATQQPLYVYIYILYTIVVNCTLEIIEEASTMEDGCNQVVLYCIDSTGVIQQHFHLQYDCCQVVVTV